MEKGRRGIQSVEIGSTLLLQLALQVRPLALRDLSKAAGLTPAKAHPYMVSFLKVGFVTQDSAGHYELGPLALQLGLARLQCMVPVREASPLIAVLASDTGQSVALAVWGNLGPTIVRWVESRRPVTVNLRTGSVMPLLHSALGLCYVSFFDSAQLRAMVDEALAINARGEDTRAPITRAQLETLVAEARKRGLTRVTGSVLPGINAFAAPVFNHDGTMALAFAGLGPAGLVPADWNGSLPQAIKAAAESASLRLGWHGAR